MHFLKSKSTFYYFVIVLLFFSEKLSGNSEENQEWTLHQSHNPQKQHKPKPSITKMGKGFCQDFEGFSYPPGARMVLQNDPCIHCFCRGSGQADCYRQNCPPAPFDCIEVEFTKPNCPSSAYNCTIPERHQSPPVVRLRDNNSRSNQLFGQRRRNLPFVTADCLIRGIAYKVGETVGVASSSCLHCYCARQSLLCIPLCCYEPISRKSRDPQLPQYHQAVHRREPHPLEYL